jgi:hypothetical protein
MTRGPDDKLTAGTHLAAILSIDIRPSGKLEGTIRDDVHLYRFSGMKGLPAAVLRWLAEVIGHPIESALESIRADDDNGHAPRTADEEKPCR